MLTLIRNARVYAPEPLGVCDVLLAGGKIAQIAEQIDLSGDAVSIIDADEAILAPGIVDVLTHPCGGGGEGGFANRTAEVDFATFANAGVTTPVGALGTDSTGRSLDVLYATTMQLRAMGLSPRMYTGAYRVPVPTMTGDVIRDLTHIDPVIGVGELAIADHRGSQPSSEELRRVAAETLTGGTLLGEGGVVFLHVGSGESRLALVREALSGSDLPPRVFFPTHCNRTPELLAEAIEHAQQGGYFDVTASTVPEFLAQGEVPVLDALAAAKDAGVADRITVSSDAGGSLPVYEGGQLTAVSRAEPGVFLDLLKTALNDGLETTKHLIAALTRNPAKALNLNNKGRIAKGCDADLLMLSHDSHGPEAVFCNGQSLLPVDAPV